MGKIVVNVKVKNFGDEELVRRGVLKAEEVREVEGEALVDTGATMLNLPEDVVKTLGLPQIRTVPLVYADNERKMRPVVANSNIFLVGRNSIFNAVVQPEGAAILIGQIVLEELDLVPNPKRGILEPNLRSPDAPLMECLACNWRLM
jgi:clan AA aspartic protease